ncbi:hypothetical protein MMB17_18825 [Methylobacterium organophilum]|uniref:GCG_CRPN prefix-to-repeats domain-containing protein n=1 Tax=Methylobacterium organophilum TaxID=410 RepID=UPI001F12A558|nr:hypothetical protein [Methylobacterium organophilum]UMY16710.1 hypothetical protein MMB17_18825 [Methylobacterium organophilum]
MIRKLALPFALSLGLLAAASGAEARDGCGPGFHRGYYGWCRPNLGVRAYGYGPVYPRFGYHRWYGYRWHDGYRYRWHRGYAWHHGGFRHAGWHGGWGWHRRW